MRNKIKNNKIKLYLFTTFILTNIILLLACFSYANNFNTPTTTITVTLDKSNAEGDWKNYINVKSIANDEIIATTDDGISVQGQAYLFQNYVVEAGIKQENGKTIPLRTKTIKVRNANQTFEIKMPQAFVNFKFSLKDSKSGYFSDEYCISLEETTTAEIYTKCDSGTQTIKILKGIYNVTISSDHILQNITKTAYIFKDKETEFIVKTKGTASVTIKFEEPLLAHANVSFIGTSPRDYMLPPGTIQETFTVVNGVTKITVSFGNWEETLKNGKKVTRGGHQYSKEYNLRNGETRLIKLNQKIDYSKIASRYGEYEKIEICASDTGKKNIAVFSMLSESTSKAIGIDNIAQWEGYIESMDNCITTPELPKGRYRVQIKNEETGQIANKYVNTQIAGQNYVLHQATYISGQPITFTAKEYITKDDAREITKFKVLVINTQTNQEYQTESTENKTIQLPKGVYQATIISEDYISQPIGFSVKDMPKTVNITATKATQWRKVIFEVDLKNTDNAVVVSDAEMKIKLYQEQGEIPLNIAGVENLEKKIIITTEIPTGKTLFTELRLKCKAGGTTTFDYVYRIKFKVAHVVQQPETPKFIFPIGITGQYVKMLAIKKDNQENEVSYDLRITVHSTSQTKIQNNLGSNTKTFQGVENLNTSTVTNGKVWLPDNTYISVIGTLNDRTDANKYNASVLIDQEKNEFIHADIQINKIKEVVINKIYKTPITYDQSKYKEPAIVLSYAQSSTHNAHILIGGKYTLLDIDNAEYQSSELLIENNKYRDRIYEVFSNANSGESDFGKLLGVPNIGTYKITAKIKIKKYKRDSAGNQVFYRDRNGNLIPQKEIKTITIGPDTVTINSGTKIGFWTKKIIINPNSATVTNLAEKDLDNEPTVEIPGLTIDQWKNDRLDICNRYTITQVGSLGPISIMKATCVMESECPSAIGCHADYWSGGQNPDGSYTYYCSSTLEREFYFVGNARTKISKNEIKAIASETFNISGRTTITRQFVHTNEDCSNITGSGTTESSTNWNDTMTIKTIFSDGILEWSQFAGLNENNRYANLYSNIPYPGKVLKKAPTLLPKRIFDRDSDKIITVTIQSDDGEPFSIIQRKIDLSQKDANGKYKTSYEYPIVKINQQPFKWPFTKTLSSSYTAKFRVAKDARDLYRVGVERGGKEWGTDRGEDITITINRDDLKIETNKVRLILKAKTEKPGGFVGKQVYATINPSQLPTARKITSNTTADAYAFWGGEIITLEVDPSNPLSTLEHVVDAPLNDEGEVIVIFYTSDLESFIAKTWYAQALRAGFNIGSSSLTLEKIEDTIMNNAEEPQGTFMWAHKTIIPTSETMAVSGTIPYIGKSTTQPITKKVIVNASSTHGFYGNVLDIAVVASVLKVAKKGTQGISKFVEIERKAADALKIVDEAAHVPNFTRHNGSFLVKKTNNVTQITNMKTGEILTETEFRSLHNKLINLITVSNKLGSIHKTIQALVTQPFTTLAVKTLGSKKGYLGDILSFIMPFGGMPPSGMPIITMKSTVESKFVVPNCQGCSEYMQITQWLTNYFNKPLQAVPVEYEIKVKPGKSIMVNAIAPGHIPFKTIIPVSENTPDTIEINFTMQRDGSFGLNPFTSTENWFTQHPMFRELFEQALLTPELYAMSAGRSNILEYMANGARDLALALYSDFKLPSPF